MFLYLILSIIIYTANAVDCSSTEGVALCGAATLTVSAEHFLYIVTISIRRSVFFFLFLTNFFCSSFFYLI